MESLKRTIMAILLLVVMTLGMAEAQMPSCASKLVACADYLNSTKPELPSSLACVTSTTALPYPFSSNSTKIFFDLGFWGFVEMVAQFFYNKMGTYLITPKTDKLFEDGVNDRLRCRLSSMQGWRASIEDAHAAYSDLDAYTSFFAVYDGRGGNLLNFRLMPLLRSLAIPPHFRLLLSNYSSAMFFSMNAVLKKLCGLNG
uniref:Pectinesterase inhibitor domain-containing protein n=1 Tax=Cannabis sativa TaxID=3483 RepID=A0A803Q8B3_CANSA